MIKHITAVGSGYYHCKAAAYMTDVGFLSCVNSRMLFELFLHSLIYGHQGELAIGLANRDEHMDFY